jgi:hypothetical protein
VTKSGRTSIRCGVDDPEGGCYCFTVFKNEWQPPHPTLPRVFIITLPYRSRDSVVDIAFRLRTGRSGVSIPADSGSFYHPQNVQSSCGTHLAFCSIAIRVLSPGVAVHSLLSSSCMPSLPEEGQLYFLPPVLNIHFYRHKVGCDSKDSEGENLSWRFEDLCLSGCRCATSTEMCSLLANCWTGGNQRVIREIISYKIYRILYPEYFTNYVYLEGWYNSVS